MDLQNVSSLVIPEGNVRTIHDKNNRLLWGKLSYDTKYVGNTMQDGAPTPDSPVPINVATGEQSVNVTGKNWFNKKATPTFRYHGTCTEIGTGVRVTCNSSTSYSYAIFVYDVSSYIGETVTLSADVSVSASNIPRISIGTCDASGGNRTQKAQNTNTGQVSVSYTIASSDHYIFANFSSNAGGTAVTGDYADYKNAQLEIGPATAYEPYQAHSYTVNLGTTELCKIGDYQDYIYKSGIDWYIHKETGSIIYDGSENWTVSLSNSRASLTKPTNWASWGSSTSTYPNKGFSNYLTGGNTGDSSSDNVFNVGSSSVFIKATSAGTATSTNAWKAWLSSNHITLYSILSSPTDTQITDSTLISQLNAIHQFLTRYGYNSSVTGNLPLIIDRTVLS